MRGWRDLDRILRGDPVFDAGPSQQTPSITFGSVALVNIALAAVYGVCMGLFGVFAREEPEFRQIAADVVKVPALFSLTLMVTFPSLYVFSVLFGSRLQLSHLARLVTASMGVTVAVLAAFGPIVAFFSLTTTSHPFIVLLNVLVFAIAGTFGVAFMLRTWEQMGTNRSASIVAIPPDPVELEDEPDEGEEEGSSTKTTGFSRSNARFVLRAWVIVFGLVGMQMSWVLRPFIGSPKEPFVWFSPKESSFFEGVIRSVRSLIGS